jgi:maltooligosyltrehalose trehalohydrolase
MIDLPERKLPFGAEVLQGGGVHFRLWAPRRSKVDLIITGGPGSNPQGEKMRVLPLESEGTGFFSVLAPDAADGTLYRYRLDGETCSFPDPASRFQPGGPHESSQVVDPDIFQWSDQLWKGIALKGQVIYEMHIGTFTFNGTWLTACEELERLAAIGITVLEVMPVFEFSGEFGWGYDGVDMFAPTRLYGRPDEFRHFVDQAHSAGLAVILDVVYNHLGPDGNYIEQYCDCFFTKKYENEWGNAINFDGPDSGPVRDFFIANACYWIREFHLDGFRFDATQQIYDNSPEHILKTICREARKAAQDRSILLTAENESQKSQLVRLEAQGGYGLDALWNDDFHHTAIAALTGHKVAYYTDYNGSPQEFISAAKWGFLYQGQYYSWQKKRRGSPTRGIRPENFVVSIENHDQISNSMYGRRCHQMTGPGLYRAMMALMLLMPGTPMLFQGQEYAGSSPFLYFADMPSALAELVRKGRSEFLTQFPGIATQEGRQMLADPSDRMTFVRCKLEPGGRTASSAALSLCRDLLKIRREDPVFRLQAECGIDGAVLATNAFVLRYFAPDARDRIVLVNLGLDLHLDHIPEPLIAPPEGEQWRILWSSEDVRYGGNGTPPVENDVCWDIPGCALVVLRSASIPAE